MRTLAAGGYWDSSSSCWAGIEELRMAVGKNVTRNLMLEAQAMAPKVEPQHMRRVKGP